MAKKDRASASSTATDVAVEEARDSDASAAPDAAQPAEAKPDVGSRVMARGKASLRVLRRRRALIVGGTVVLVGLNVWMAFAVDGWRGEDVALQADNGDLGMRLADARATAASQVEEIALVTNQAAAAQAKADELAPVAEAQQAVADSLKAAGMLLRQCVNDRGTLIANLWVSSASAQAGLEAGVDATCASAQAAFDAIPKEN
jgi:hypothetical protein